MIRIIVTMASAFIYQIILASFITSGVKALSKDCGKTYVIDFFVLDSIFCALDTGVENK